MKILLADDDQFTLAVLSSYIEADGHQVIPVTNGWDALNKLETEGKFDMIISDVFMPEISGLMIGNLVKQFFYFKTPLILISSNNTAAVRRAITQAGADGFLTKPINKTDFISLIHTIKHI